MTEPLGLDPRALVRGRSRVPLPWSSDQVVWLTAANGAGAILVLAAWWVVSGTGHARDQVGWMNVSIVGLAIAFATDVWFLARGRRVVQLAREETFGARPRAAARSVHRPATAVAVLGPLVSVPGTSWFHRPGCALVGGKAVTEATRAVWERGGSAACQVCRP